MRNPKLPTISQFFGILIRMFFDDHPPPHFHAVYNEHKAVIDIQRLEVMEGRLPRRALSLVLDWAELHQAELLADWELCQARELPLKIAPLE
jgi:hypothetical protein